MLKASQQTNKTLQASIKFKGSPLPQLDLLQSGGIRGKGAGRWFPSLLSVTPPCPLVNSASGETGDGSGNILLEWHPYDAGFCQP